MRNSFVTATQRFQSALALFEVSVSMKRQRLRQQNPTASEEQIDLMLAGWLVERPGAPDGDCPGRARSWPRS